MRPKPIDNLEHTRWFETPMLRKLRSLNGLVGGEIEIFGIAPTQTPHFDSTGVFVVNRLPSPVKIVFVGEQDFSAALEKAKSDQPVETRFVVLSPNQGIDQPSPGFDLHPKTLIHVHTNLLDDFAINFLTPLLRTQYWTVLSQKLVPLPHLLHWGGAIAKVKKPSITQIETLMMEAQKHFRFADHVNVFMHHVLNWAKSSSSSIASFESYEVASDGVYLTVTVSLKTSSLPQLLQNTTQAQADALYMVEKTPSEVDITWLKALHRPSGTPVQPLVVLTRHHKSK